MTRKAAPRGLAVVVLAVAWAAPAYGQEPAEPPAGDLTGSPASEPEESEGEPAAAEPADEDAVDPAGAQPPQESEGEPAAAEPADADAGEAQTVRSAGRRRTDPQLTTAPIRYFIERVEVRGNTRTRSRIVRRFVPLEHGDVLDVDDPEIESIRWRLLGTGWFHDVRLRLRKGSQRGWVVLVVEVEERNTFVIQQLALGVSEGLNKRGDDTDEVVLYGGLSVAETNLLGLGITLAATALASKPQQGFELAFSDPSAFGSEFFLLASAFFNNAREFFGHEPLVTIRCPEGETECPEEVEAKNAVVLYRRGGIGLGTGHDLGASTRYTLEWRGERINVRARPEAASETRGSEVRPIDFSIEDGVSYVSSIRVGLFYDRRDDPALPSQGILVRFLGDGSSRVLGSDYDFLRLQGLLRYWIPLPWKHYLRLGAFAGVVFGDAPFFYKFHHSDLSDLIPSRVLEMELDRRSPPNLLGTSIEVMRSEEIAGRVDIEYGLHLYRGGEGFFRTVTGYGGVGLYGLADIRDLQTAIPGYDGAARLPIDLTFDIGLRADTAIGVFQLGFSNILGFFAL